MMGNHASASHIETPLPYPALPCPAHVVTAAMRRKHLQQSNGALHGPVWLKRSTHTPAIPPFLALFCPCCSDEEEAFAAAPEDAPGCTAWAATLKHSGYDSLSLQQRLEALLWLGGLVGEGPGVRGRLEAREREAAALRKQLLEDGRVSTGHVMTIVASA